MGHYAQSFCKRASVARHGTEEPKELKILRVLIEPPALHLPPKQKGHGLRPLRISPIPCTVHEPTVILGPRTQPRGCLDRRYDGVEAFVSRHQRDPQWATEGGSGPHASRTEFEANPLLRTLQWSEHGLATSALRTGQECLLKLMVSKLNVHRSCRYNENLSGPFQPCLGS